MRRFLLFLLLVLLVCSGWLAYEFLAPYKGFSGNGVIVDIPKGDSVRGIARILERQGVIRNRYAFILLARRYAGRKLEAGEYYFTQTQTPAKVFDTIASGRVFEVAITVPEGFNSMQIATLLDQNGLVAKDDFLSAVQDITP